jgi:putative ABC transport system substrate-binding protein
MRRRTFIAALGGAAGLAFAARAQPAMPVIGFLHIASARPFAHVVAGFHRGLKEAGFTENQNLSIEYRWAEGQRDRLPELAADLVLSRPGGNATGVNILTEELAAKRFGLLHDRVSAGTVIAHLVNPNYPPTEFFIQEVDELARAKGRPILLLKASGESGIDAAFAEISQRHAGALLVAADPYFNSRRDQIVALATRHALPAIYEQREFALVGGLMSYGTSITDAYRQLGIYAGRILKGEKPADLPVAQAAKFELVVNLKTAKTLGLTLPSGLLSIVDEVIE